VGLTSSTRVTATAKHWIWVATALNFVVPLGALVDSLFASHTTWAKPLGVVGGAGAAVANNVSLAAALCAGWSIGAAVMLARLCARSAIERQFVEATLLDRFVTTRSFRTGGVLVRFIDPQHAPAVNGVWRSYISLPQGIERLLSERELTSVLIHKLAHARRHDNLRGLVFEIALCALWFHPLLWMTGSRVALYRDLSCDESVIAHGHGRELLAALTKLADFDERLLLRATVTSLFAHRLARLTRTGGARGSGLGDAVFTMCFGLVLVAGVPSTVAQTARCFAAKI
jgi:beta-lactamase regulating signal transducer with metallopeptidase domain